MGTPKKSEIKVCARAECKKEFSAKHSGHKYCSKECYELHDKEYMKIWRKQRYEASKKLLITPEDIKKVENEPDKFKQLNEINDKKLEEINNIPLQAGEHGENNYKSPSSGQSCAESGFPAEDLKKDDENKKEADMPKA